MPNLNDVPAMLRKTAKDIEAGDYGKTTAAVLIINGKEPAAFGFGRAGAKTALKLIESGKRIIRASAKVSK